MIWGGTPTIFGNIHITWVKLHPTYRRQSYWKPHLFHWWQAVLTLYACLSPKYFKALISPGSPNPITSLTSLRPLLSPGGTAGKRWNFESPRRARAGGSLLFIESWLFNRNPCYGYIYLVQLGSIIPYIFPEQQWFFSYCSSYESMVLGESHHSFGKMEVPLGWGPLFIINLI